ncbi:hypothetical protein JMJ78_0002225, partial [Colletotrichum scovillei]
GGGGPHRQRSTLNQRRSNQNEAFNKSWHCSFHTHWPPHAFYLRDLNIRTLCAVLHGHQPLAVPPEGSPMYHEPDEPANATGIYQAFRRNLGCTTPERENDRTISNMTARTPQMQLRTTMTLSSFEPSSTLELSTFGRSYSRLNQTTMFASPDDCDNPGSLRTSGPPKSPRCGGSNGVLVFGRQAEIRKDSASGVLARRDQAKMPVGLLAEWALLHSRRAHALLASSYELQTLKGLLGFCPWAAKRVGMVSRCATIFRNLSASWL